MHQGVGLLIINKNNNTFFVQQKDKNYLPEKWINALSFWGGEVETEDMTPYYALIRELDEELKFVLNFEKRIKLVDNFLVISNSDYNFCLYELFVNNSEFDLICNSQVSEGVGVIKSKQQLLSTNWVWGLENVIKKYLCEIVH